MYGSSPGASVLGVTLGTGTTGGVLAKSGFAVFGWMLIAVALIVVGAFIWRASVMRRASLEQS